MAAMGRRRIWQVFMVRAVQEQQPGSMPGFNILKTLQVRGLLFERQPTPR
jgi:hypothetical protein